MWFHCYVLFPLNFLFWINTCTFFAGGRALFWIIRWSLPARAVAARARFHVLLWLHYFESLPVKYITEHNLDTFSKVFQSFSKFDSPNLPCFCHPTLWISILFLFFFLYSCTFLVFWLNFGHVRRIAGWCGKRTCSNTGRWWSLASASI